MPPVEANPLLPPAIPEPLANTQPLRADESAPFAQLLRSETSTSQKPKESQRDDRETTRERPDTTDHASKDKPRSRVERRAKRTEGDGGQSSDNLRSDIKHYYDANSPEYGTAPAGPKREEFPSGVQEPVVEEGSDESAALVIAQQLLAAPPPVTPVLLAADATPATEEGATPVAELIAPLAAEPKKMGPAPLAARQLVTTAPIATPEGSIDVESPTPVAETEVVAVEPIAPVVEAEITQPKAEKITPQGAVPEEVAVDAEDSDTPKTSTEIAETHDSPRLKTPLKKTVAATGIDDIPREQPVDAVAPEAPAAEQQRPDIVRDDGPQGRAERRKTKSAEEGGETPPSDKDASAAAVPSEIATTSKQESDAVRRDENTAAAHSQPTATAAEASPTQHRPEGGGTTNLPPAEAAPRRWQAGIGLRETTGESRGSTLHVDSARFLQRVVRAFQAADERGSEVRLRLSPPELGALRLEVAVRDGVLTARVETETSSARTLLIDNLPQLRERLAEQGMKIDRFDVDVSGRQPGGMPDPRQQPQEQSPGDDRARGNAARSPQRPIDNEPPRRPRAGGDSNGLNVLV